jgi:hypothetical protein
MNDHHKDMLHHLLQNHAVELRAVGKGTWTKHQKKKVATKERRQSSYSLEDSAPKPLMPQTK